MTAWPGSLPQTPLNTGYVQSIKDTAIRSSMDQGPDKLRRRVTRDIRLIQMQFVMTTAQVNTLRTFYNSTIQGTGTVDWSDDLTGEESTYRFVGPPAYSFIEAGQWSVSITFEVYSSGAYIASVAASVGAATASADATINTGPVGDGLLAENGNFLITESGNYIILE